MWAGAVLSAAILIAWIAGWWGQVGWETWDPGPRVITMTSVGCGEVYFARFVLPLALPDAAYSRPFTSFAPAHQRSKYWSWLPTLETRYLQVGVPLWIPLALVLGPTLWLWRTSRQAIPGGCPVCGYDLTGTATAVCPECGARCKQRPGPAAVHGAV